MTQLLLQTCQACGHIVFPARVLCPRCGSRDWSGQVALNGTVEQVTTDRMGSRIALIATDLGPHVIARADGLASGTRVELAAHGGVVIASATQ